MEKYADQDPEKVKFSLSLALSISQIYLCLLIHIWKSSFDSSGWWVPRMYSFLGQEIIFNICDY